MENILLKRRELFFNNLLLLGLDKQRFEKEHGISFHKDMFFTPNKKAYEVVTNFLFSRLHEVTGENYNIPWPLLSKEHERIFQKTCYAHLLKFSRENVVKFPLIVKSILTTYGGDRFYAAYLALSNYVLYKAISKNGNVNLISRPIISSKEQYVAAKSHLQLATILHMKKFLDVETLTHHSHLIWIKFSKNLQKWLYELKQLLKINEELLKQDQQLISSLYSTNPEETLSLKQMIERCLECWKPLLKQRRSLETFIMNEKKFWDYLASEIGEDAKSEYLNGQAYNICIDDLPEEFRKRLENVGFSSTEIDGKLSILRFMKLFTAYLMYVEELLKKRDLKEVHKIISEEDISSLQNELHSAEKINKILSEEMPVIEENIEKLELIHSFDDPKEEMELSCRQLLTMPNLSFKPEDVKERTKDQCTSFINNPPQLLLSGEDVCHEEFNVSALRPEETNSADPSSTGVTPKKKKIVPLPGELFSSDTEPSSPSSLSLNISGFDDTVFASSTSFKMRESWCNEESLSAVTLPDDSLVE